MMFDSSDETTPDSEPGDNERVLLSDEPTVELIVKAKAGNDAALDAVLQRCLPPLRRWAHGRLPSYARGNADTEDLVQQAVTNVLARLEQFHPAHVGAMQGYLRRCVINDIRTRIRTISRRSVPEELPDDLVSDEVSPLERALTQESYENYRAALLRLSVRDREIILARVEAQWTLAELMERFGFNTANAARMATSRAMRRLQAEMGTKG